MTARCAERRTPIPTVVPRPCHGRRRCTRSVPHADAWHLCTRVTLTRETTQCTLWSWRNWCAPSSPPVLDGLFFFCLTAALWFVVTGSLRTVVDGDPLTVKWSDAIVAALVVAVLRHAVLLQPSLWTTLRRWKAWITSRPELADALLALGVTRVAVLVVGLIAVTAVGFPPESGQLGSGRQAVSGLMARFDGNCTRVSQSRAITGMERSIGSRTSRSSLRFPC